MKTMTLAIIVSIALLLVSAGIVMAINNNASKNSPEQENQIASCSSCGNSCSSGNNCGLETCGAVQGGSCGCGR